MVTRREAIGGVAGAVAAALSPSARASMFLSGAASASSSPVGQPLIQATNIEYLGNFTVPPQLTTTYPSSGGTFTANLASGSKSVTNIVPTGLIGNWLDVGGAVSGTGVPGGASLSGYVPALGIATLSAAATSDQTGVTLTGTYTTAQCNAAFGGTCIALGPADTSTGQKTLYCAGLWSFGSGIALIRIPADGTAGGSWGTTSLAVLNGKTMGMDNTATLAMCQHINNNSHQVASNTYPVACGAFRYNGKLYVGYGDYYPNNYGIPITASVIASSTTISGITKRWSGASWPDGIQILGPGVGSPVTISGYDSGTGTATLSKAATSNQDNQTYILVQKPSSTGIGYNFISLDEDLTNPTLDLQLGSPLGYDMRSFSGAFGAVGSEWQSLLGAPMVASQGPMAISGSLSYGPGGFLFNPANLVPSGIIGTMSFYAPATIGNDGIGAGSGSSTGAPAITNWASPNPYWTSAERMCFAAIPSGFSTLMFMGMHGSQGYEYGGMTATPSLNGSFNGSETVFYDTIETGKGNHSYPYMPYVWLYKMSDVLLVLDGASPSAIRPYAAFQLPVPASQVGPGAWVTQNGSGCFDPDTGRFYFCRGGISNPITVHVWQLSQTTGSPLSVTTPVSLAAATVGQPYSASLSPSYSGGTSPYTCTLMTSILLPTSTTCQPDSSMSVSSSGTVSGTPTAAGTLWLTSSVEDAAGVIAYLTATIVVNA